MSQKTYTQHIHTAQATLSNLAEHANQHLVAAIAQAHATVAIALLLEELLDSQTEPNHSDSQPYQTIRIIGGLGTPTHTAH